MEANSVEADLFQFVIEMEALGRRASRAIVGESLLAGDARLLFGLLSADQTQAELSRFLSMDSGQVARIIRRLKEKGLVALSSTEPSRKGSKALSLTAAGRYVAFAAQRRRYAVISEFLEVERHTKLARLFHLCKRLGDRQYDADHGPFVRKAAVGDFGWMMYIAAKTLNSGYLGNFDPEIERFLASSYLDYIEARPRSVFLIAEYWGYVGGGLVAVPATGQDPNASPTEARIPLIAVDMPFIGRRLGTHLIDAAIPELRQLGYSSVTAVEPKNPHEGTFFGYLGWAREGRCRPDAPRSTQVYDCWRLCL